MTPTELAQELQKLEEKRTSGEISQGVFIARIYLLGYSEGYEDAMQDVATLTNAPRESLLDKLARAESDYAHHEANK